MRKRLGPANRGGATPDSASRPGLSGGTARVLATDEQAGSASESHLRQPDERDESADQQRTGTRRVMQQAHADVESGQQDTDARNRVAEVLPDVPKTPKNFDEKDSIDQSPRTSRNTGKGRA